MPGLTPRAIDEMFRVMGERHHCQFKVTSSFMELYNNQLVDLFWVLDNQKSKEKPPALEIRQDSKGIIYVQGAVIKDVESSEDLMMLFNTGNLKRHVGATNMNKESSRSHSVFCIMVESYDTSTKKTTFGKLSLVDLAGSERQDKTGKYIHIHSVNYCIIDVHLQLTTIETYFNLLIPNRSYWREITGSKSYQPVTKRLG